jgi:hypothetical protein
MDAERVPGEKAAGDAVGDAARDSGGGLARFRRRGRLCFQILAAFTAVIGGTVLVVAAPAVPLPILLTAAAGVALFLVVCYLVVTGLGSGRAWADHATVAVCTILLVAGIIRSLVRLTAGSIDIPIDAIAAAIVLSVRPAGFQPTADEDRPRLWFVVGLAAISAIAGLVPVNATQIQL